MELIVVVAILGVLATMVVPAYTENVYRASCARCQGDLATIDKEVQAYFIDKNTYPPSGPGGLTAIGRSTMRDPWGKPYEYRMPSSLDGKSGLVLNDNGDYDLFSKGRNGLSADGFVAGDCDDDIVRAGDGTTFDLRSKF